MYFNISYDIVTLLLIFGITISNLMISDKSARSSKSFKVCILLLAISTTFDILAALTGADILCDSDEVNIILETAYMCTGLYCLYASFIAIASRIRMDFRKASQIIFAFVTIYTFLLLYNLPTRLLFNIIDGVYDNHPLFYVAYSIPVFVMFHTVIVLVSNRYALEKKVFWTMLFAVIAPIICVIIQVINDRLILIQFGLGITVFVLNFIWETPDASKLEKTILELEEAKKSEEASRYEIEMADRAKSRFLSNISEELLHPISEIQEYANQIIEANPENEIGANADEIASAGNQFKELLNKLTN